MIKNTHFIITGPSGVGKTTICRILKERLPELTKFVTTTTRPPRPGEVNGRDYYFVTEAQFKKDIANNEFFEWDHHYGNYYGSSKIKFTEFVNTTPLGVFILDPTGARTVKSLMPEIITIFVKPETHGDIVTRLYDQERKDDNPIARLTATEKEIEQVNLFDCTIINRQGYIYETVDQIQKIITEAQK